MKIWRVDWLPVLAIAVGAIMGVTVFDTVEDYVEGDFDEDDIRAVVAGAPTADARRSPDARGVTVRSDRKSSTIRAQPSATPGSGRVARVSPKLTLTKTDGPARVIRLRGRATHLRRRGPAREDGGHRRHRAFAHRSHRDRQE